MGVAEKAQNSPTGRERRIGLPVEDFGAAPRLNTRAEIVEWWTIRVGHEDFRDTRLHAMGDNLAQWVDEFVPKADIGADDQIERGKIAGFEVLKGKVARLHVDAIELGVLMQVGEHRRVGVKCGNASVKRLGAIDTEQSPATAEFQNTDVLSNAALCEIVHQQKTGAPDLFPVQGG